MRDYIAKARKAQQENEQKHNVQLEISMKDCQHTQECLDAQLMHHAATGGDLENCWCPSIEIFGPGPDCDGED